MSGTEEEPRAVDQDVWGQGLIWVEAARMQAYRLQESLAEWNAALLDAQMRRSLNDDSDRAAEWRESYGAREPYDPGRPLRVPTHALHMQLSSEAALGLSI